MGNVLISCACVNLSFRATSTNIFQDFSNAWSWVKGAPALSLTSGVIFWLGRLQNQPQERVGRGKGHLSLSFALHSFSFTLSLHAFLSLFALDVASCAVKHNPCPFPDHFLKRKKLLALTAQAIIATRSEHSIQEKLPSPSLTKSSCDTNVTRRS